MRTLLQTPLLPEVAHYIQKLAQFREEWRVAVGMRPEVASDLKASVIITSAGASTRIEGAKLSDEEIRQRLSGLTIRSIRDRDEAEVAGYIDCKRYIFEEFPRLDVSEHTIRSLHQMMMSYLPDAVFPMQQRGVYKNVPNAVVRIDHASGTEEVIFETTPPGPQTEAAMDTLVREYQACIHDSHYADLEVIAALIVQFLAIHPFRDGNGRLSRLLTDLCLLQQGYAFCMYASHEKVIEAAKEQYYVALRQTQASMKSAPDINPWFLYFLKVLCRQTEQLTDRLHKKTPGSLTTREQQIYDLIRAHQPVAIGFLQRESHLARVTVKSILARLKVRGIVAMEGTRKGSRYRVV